VAQEAEGVSGHRRLIFKVLDLDFGEAAIPAAFLFPFKATGLCDGVIPACQQLPAPRGALKE
jgi:hypothetical protein